ncbi:SufD family Fe-S cluster assembly protein [Desulfocurvibacter africanus]|uniref:SufBD protein n=2 Tax=Desulfocurvibacter africanus TaxID=873 RepID=F3Z3Q0_DESAF|nr:SufD family Fe-S cluster assembly protein [Desulfocurvibacter africanus]EGJ51515.1 SufBD protein [Desulfocurvibacter africanus subsp. africanus str. Walvis Bay]EMG37673.1 ABC-type transport system involved in Fe-S cluster assembly, permease component [Desulfocurvibacter africanus PCS]
MCAQDIDLSKYEFEGIAAPKLGDLRSLDADDREQLLMSGIDVEEQGRSGSFLHVNHASAYCHTAHPGVEILDIKDALAKYDGLKDYFWKLVDKDKDEYTRMAAEHLQGGYFVRVKKGVKVPEPVQSCLFIKANRTGQSVHNVVILEEDAELHMITGCAVSKHSKTGLHLGISEFFVGKNAKLTFSMVHNWGEDTEVRPRSAGIVDEGGVFLNNYILLKPVKSVQMYPSITLAGRGAVARFNSVMVAPKGSHIDSGNRVIMAAPDCKAEIIARTITTGGTIINRGDIQGRAVPGRGHLECKGLILGDGIIHAIPELYASVEGVELSHEAAVGKIAQEEIEYLMARGMDEEEATSTIVRGFLNVDIMGLPAKLKQAVDQTIQETEKDMF